jgi:hypothetical protein
VTEATLSTGRLVDQLRLVELPARPVGAVVELDARLGGPDRGIHIALLQETAATTPVCPADSACDRKIRPRGGLTGLALTNSLGRGAMPGRRHET